MAKEDGQWKPGQSGNPGGRPKGLSITAEIRRLLGETPNAKEDLAKAILEQAKGGNAAALKEVLARIDGPVPVAINVSQLSNEQLLAALESAVGAGGEEAEP